MTGGLKQVLRHGAHDGVALLGSRVGDVLIAQH
ncbi:hypothetical protein AU375_03980 [Methylobacterium radiotolerans]|nr:hypothetical protein AU375_03980 [Methylobacterium radiotolerans]